MFKICGTSFAHSAKSMALCEYSITPAQAGIQNTTDH
jgi:hypothetical protein